MAGAVSSKGLGRSCLLLIVTAGIERFAFKGVASNLVTYLIDKFQMSSSSAAKTVTVWYGLTYLLPLLVAPVIDSYWGHFSAIQNFSLVYVVGLVGLTFTALKQSSSPNIAASSDVFLFWSLCLVSLGQAGFKPSLQAFGADQQGNEDEMSSKNEQGSCRKTLLFQWWYFGTCCGILLGVTVMSYIQDTYGWVLGFGIPSVAMVISFALFLCGRMVYSYRDDKAINSTLFQNLIQVVKAGLSKVKIGSKITLESEKSQVNELELQGKPLFHDQEAGYVDCIDEKPENGIFVLEKGKVILGLLPVWMTLLIFAITFQQPATFFIKQGMTMERNIGKNFKVPPATLQSAITLSIILLMPLYDKIFIPITRIICRNEKGISVRQRIGIGMVLSIIAMVIAAIVERKRLETGQIKMEDPELILETVPLSIFWLLPQYILLGISIMFTEVGMQELFYSQVPTNMRTTGLALYASVSGVAGFLSAFLVYLVELVTRSREHDSWFSDDMRESRLDKYYWLLATLSTLSLIFYVILCKYRKGNIDVESENDK